MNPVMGVKRINLSYAGMIRQKIIFFSLKPHKKHQHSKGFA